MSALQGMLGSRRVNKWLPWVAATVLAAGILTFVAVKWNNTAQNESTPVSNRPAYVPPKTPHSVKLSESARKVAAAFIEKAVSGNDPVAAYRLSGPGIRQGESLAAWKRDWANPDVGVPIVPYPAAKNAEMKVDYSWPREAQIEIVLSPKNGHHIKPQLFIMGLKKLGAGRYAHWVVDYWATKSVPQVLVDPGK